MTEDQLEQEALGWLASVGYTPLNARDLDHLDPRLARTSNREVVLAVCLRAAIDRLNPTVPAAAREDAFKQVLDLGQPALLSGNRAFHRVLVTGVPVQYQKDGETRGDFVRLVDWQELPDAHACRFAIWRQDSPIEDEAQWAAHLDWFVQRIVKMNAVFRPVIQALG